MALIPPGTSLLSASGLLLRSREAVGRCDRLLQKLGQLGRKSSGDIAALHLVDEISKVICAVLEPAAFLAAIAETGSETAQIAQIAHADLARFLAELNARPEPYEALLAVERDVELMGQMDQQDKQMLWDMKAELESNGAKMRSREERENADRIQREIFQLEQRFLNCIEASTYCQVSFQDIESVSDALFPTREGNFGIFKSPNNPVTIKASWLPIIIQRCKSSPDRQIAYTALNSLSPENITTLETLVRKRAELAQLYGFKSYADYKLKSSLLGSSELVGSFTEGLVSLLKERSSSNFTFSDWDALYFRPNTVFEQIKEEVQNYLEFSSCIKSLEFLANEFGLTLRQSHVQESELWEKSAESRVKKFEVLNLSNGHLRGILYLDVWHGHQQAAHYNIQTGFAGDPRYNISGMYQVSYLVIPGPSSVSTQIQVSYDFLKTLFHEFGHALQAMCSNTRFQHLGGIRGPLDFVEIPSTFVETFASDYDFLSKFCRHRITGKSLDHELIQNLKSSDRYKRSNMQSQCVLALADQIYSGNDALHLYKKSNSISSVWHDTYYEVFERSMESSLHPQSSRSHLITYGSLYYSYLLAKIVCSQVWNNQFKSLEDGLTGALKFRREILDPGLSRPPSESIQALLGENTDIRDVKFLRKLSHEYIQNELTHHGHNLS